MSLILPGENPESAVKDSENVAFGPNILQMPLDHPRSLVAGVLTTKQKHSKKSKSSTTVAYIDTNTKRYVAGLRDHVIGVVIGKAANGYKVMLQEGSPSVFLDAFAFENASKKNRPNLAPDTLVYARVSLADPEIEVNIECFDSASGKSAGFGELKGGYCITVGLGYARELLKGTHPVLQALGEKVPYEIAIGVNGRIWVNSEDPLMTLNIAEILTKAETTAPLDIDELLNKIFGR